MQDLTQQNNHAISLVCKKIHDIMAEYSGLKPYITNGPHIVSKHDNYDALYYDDNDVTRDTRYTHYLEDGTLKRTHTTSAIPHELTQTKDDRLIIVNGMVYRRDVIDRTQLVLPTKWTYGY